LQNILNVYSNSLDNTHARMHAHVYIYVHYIYYAVN